MSYLPCTVEGMWLVSYFLPG